MVIMVFKYEVRLYSHVNKNNIVSGTFGQMQEGSYYNIDDVATNNNF